MERNASEYGDYFSRQCSNSHVPYGEVVDCLSRGEVLCVKNFYHVCLTFVTSKTAAPELHCSYFAGNVTFWQFADNLRCFVTMPFKNYSQSFSLAKCIHR